MARGKREPCLDQGHNRCMEAGIIGTARTAVVASIDQFTLCSGKIFVDLRQIVVQRCHSSGGLYRICCSWTRAVQLTPVYMTMRGDSPRILKRRGSKSCAQFELFVSLGIYTKFRLNSKMTVLLSFIIDIEYVIIYCLSML